MVAENFFKFREYRDKSAALKNSAQDVLGIIDNLPDFNAANKYLLRRANVSDRMKDSLIRGQARIKPLLNKLIGEIDNELAEVDKMLDQINIPGSNIFKQFQRSAVSHQNRQAGILKELYSLGISFFGAIEEQIHVRIQSVEQSHAQFREKVTELLIVLVETPERGAIANSWAECLEFLILYTRDDFELGLPRHTYKDLVEAERAAYPRHILATYFNFGLGEGMVRKIRNAGLIRKAGNIEQNTNYYDLSESAQEKVDKEIKDSLIKLLAGITFIHPQTGRFYQWDKDSPSDDEKKELIKHIIEEVYKGSDDEQLTDEYKAAVTTAITDLRNAISSAGYSIKGLLGTVSGSHDKLVWLKRDGTEITLKNLLSSDDPDGLYQEKHFDEFNHILEDIVEMTKGDKPEKNNQRFIDFLALNEAKNIIENRGGSSTTSPSPKDSRRKWNDAKTALKEFVQLKGSDIPSFTDNADFITFLGSIGGFSTDPEFKIRFSNLMINLFTDDVSNITNSGTRYECDNFKEILDYVRPGAWGPLSSDIDDLLIFVEGNFDDLINANFGSDTEYIDFFTKLLSLIPLGPSTKWR